MDLIKIYGNIIKNNLSNNDRALNLIKFGLSLENLRVNKFPEKIMPKSFQYLNQICLDFILSPLKHPDSSAWVNLFAPCEILHAMDIKPLSIEALSSFLSGLMCEDSFIDEAEKNGISETLCSYHKAFIGASETRILPKPRFALTTTSICDANTNTFKYLCSKHNVPLYIIDIPYQYNENSENYVVYQLKEAVKFIEEISHQSLDLDKLKEVIKIENETTKFRKEYINSLKDRYLKTTLTLEMYMLFTSHIFMGTKETCEFYKRLSQEIKAAPYKNGTSIFWVHLIPFYHPILKEYFNFSEDYHLLGCDLNFDYLEEMDCTDPFRALARKLILNHGNGCYERKAASILNLIEEMNADAVINFCHFGCKQSSGGVMLLKEELMKRNIPFLSLDGDGIDRRTQSSGQIKTRLEAFFEMIKKNNEV